MSVAAGRYAKALMDVLDPDKSERGLEQLSSFSSLLSEQPDIRRVLENPAVPAARRKDLIKEIADALSVDKVIRNFLNLIAESNRLELMEEIVAAYQTLLDEKQGIVRAQVKSAQPLDSAQQRDVIARLAKLTGKQVRIEVSVDPLLIGGVIAQVGSTIYDGSIRQQLLAFKDRLIQN